MEGRGGRASCCLTWGQGRAVSMGLARWGGADDLPTSLMAVCAGGMLRTLLLLTSCFCSGCSEVAVEFFGLFVSFVQNLP